MINSNSPKIFLAGLALAAATAGAQPIKPIYGATAGSVSEVAVATTVASIGARASDVAAAVINGSGKLEVIAWQDTTTALKKLGSATAPGNATSIAIAGLDAKRVVTASYEGNFVIDVNTWELGGADQGVVRQNGDSSQPGYTGAVAITRLSSKLVAVAFVDPSDDNLFVYAYRISAAGVPTEIAAEGVPGAADSALGMLGLTTVNANTIMTATRDLSGNLQVRTWKIGSADVYVADTYTAGPVKRVSIGAEFDTGNVMTSTVNGVDEVENIYWTVSSSGHISRGTTVTAGVVTQTTAAWLPSGIRITAVRSGHGQLDIQQWQDPFLASNGLIASYSSTSDISQLALTAEGSGPKSDDEIESYFVTGARSSKGDLQVQVWQTPMAVTPPPK
jgi:hypothetical protein